MNPLIVSYSDTTGGAARAAYRLHSALRQADVASEMQVLVKKGGNPWVHGPKSKVAQGWAMARGHIGRLAMRLQVTGNEGLHSPSMLPGGLIRSVLVSQADVINLHWINEEALTIEAIAKLRKPVVWTLHDMWAFCGAENYCEDDDLARFKVGYLPNNRSPGHSKLDIDRWVWQRKCKAWQHPMHLISPSSWLADCARSSKLMADWPIDVIPNVLDTKRFQPLDKNFCRLALGLPLDVPVVAFGAIGGESDKRKGFGLLLQSLSHLANEGWAGLCVVFGQDEPKEPLHLGVPLHYLGRLHDDATLALLYNAADVVVVPSRQENLPQSATEAQACGCPVVAFNCTGLPDAVEHGVTGYLAKAYDPVGLARGIQWVLSGERQQTLRIAARERALRLWAPEVVVPQYIDVYRRSLESHANKNNEK